jgi:hypothetical protein
LKVTRNQGLSNAKKVAQEMLETVFAFDYLYGCLINILVGLKIWVIQCDAAKPKKRPWPEITRAIQNY